MSVQALSWAMAQTTGSGTRKAVLMALANCHNHHTRMCHPRVATIAADSEYNERTVKRALEQLQEGGFIVKIHTRRNGHQGVTKYILGLDFASNQSDSPPLSQGDTVAPQEPEVDLEPSVETYVSTADASNSAQKTPLDLLWDACEIHVQKAPISKSHRKGYAKLVREMLTGGWTPEMVRERARLYRRHQTLGQTILSLAALAKWGEELANGKRSPAERKREEEPHEEPLPPEENARLARELIARMSGVLKDVPA